MANIFTTSNISFADIQKEFNPTGANKVPRDPISIGDFYSDAPSKFAPGIPGIPIRGNPISVSQFIGKKKAEESDWFYTTPGTYTWTCPPGILSVNIVCIGGGGKNGFSGGGGGGLGWANNISVTPGTNYTVVVGGPSGISYFNSTSIVYGGGGGSADTGGIESVSFIGYYNGGYNYNYNPNGQPGGGYGGSGSSFGGGNGAYGTTGTGISYGGSVSQNYQGVGGNAGRYDGNGTGAGATGTGLLGLPDSGSKYGAGGNGRHAYGQNGAIRIIYSFSGRNFPNNATTLGTKVYYNLTT